MANVVSDAIQPSPVTIDALTRDGGQSISTVQSGGTRTLLLTQPSIVRLHAAAQSVVRYERQGDDLILHLQDGSTLVCKNYFLETDGQHSELVFDNGASSVTHAAFPVAAQGGLTPQFETLAGIDPLFITHSHSMTYLASALGALAFGGVIAAAGAGGGGGGDSDNGSGPTPPAPAGVLTLGIMAGDNVLNAAEAQNGLLISGTSANLAPGSLVTITLGDKSYSAQVQQDGSWQVMLSPQEAQALADGTVQVRASATDETGKTVSSESALLVVTHTLPAPTIDTAFGDNLLNLAESQTTQTLTGSTGISGAGQTVLVSLNGVSYSATVDGDGRWTLTLPPEVLSQLAQGELGVSVTATDAFGNSGAGNAALLVDTQPPAVTLNAVTGDNLLNLIETRLPIDISGTTEPGAQIVVNYNNLSWSATADAQGNWLVTVPPDTLSDMSNGLYPLTVTASDAAGNSAAVSESVVMAMTPPEPTLNTPFGDGALNSQEVQQLQLLSGTSGAFGANQTVAINIGGFNVRELAASLLGSDGRWQVTVDPAAGGNNYIATVDANGNWSLELPPEILQQLNNGEVSITVVAADGLGNLGATPQEQFEVDTTPPELSINPVAGDDIINALESQSDLILSGASLDLESGQPVNLTFNGVTYTTTVDGSGNWSVTVPAAALASLPEGVVEIILATQDAAGNPSSLNHVITIDTELSLTFNPVAGDDIINALESSAPIILSGLASADVAGHTITLTLNGVNYTASILSDGTWSTAVPPEDLVGLTDGVYTINATLSDPAGNNLTVPHSFTLDADPATLPTLTINPVAGDNILSAAEAGQPLFISGTTTNVEAGQTVTLDLAGNTLTATVGSNGGWIVQVPAEIVSALSQGNQTISGQVSDTSGNPGVAAGGFLVDTQVALTVNPVAADDIINAAEAGAGVAVSGTADPADAGRMVSLTLSGLSYIAAVQADGSWSATVPAADLASLADGQYTITASLTDAAGNSISVPHTFTLDSAVTLTVNPVAADDIINAAEAGAGVAVSGTANPADAGRTVSLTLSGLSYSAMVQADGSWSATVPAADLASLADGQYTINASLTDAAGNTLTVPHAITLDAAAATLPTLIINAVSQNNYINSSEITQPLILSGVTTNVEAGRTVALEFAGNPLSAVVGADGLWSVEVPASVITALTPGIYIVTGQVSDASGNLQNATGGFIVDLNVDLTVNPIATDDIINAAEAGAGVVVSGTASLLDAEREVAVTLNGVSYSATVQADGSWSVTLPAADLAALADGPYTLTASLADAAGNSISVPRAVTLDTAVALSVNPIAADDVINAAEAATDVAITGTADLADVGRTVTVSLNSFSYSATVQADGSWSATLPAADLATLADGPYTLTASLADAAGNSTSAPHAFTLDKAVTLTVNPIATDDIINAAEAGAGVAVSGTADAADVGRTVSLTLSGLSYSATVQADGSWSATLPAADLATLADGPYTLTASLADAAGNSTSVPHSVTLDAAAATLPTLLINAVFDDNYINAQESSQPLTITGVAFNVEEGRTVTLTLNDTLYTATVGPLGEWSTTIPADVISALADGVYTLIGRVSDASGNETEAGGGFTVDTVATLTIDPVATDDLINLTESQADVMVSGSASTADVGEEVTVTLNGESWTTLIQDDGSWSTLIPSTSLSTMLDGLYVLQATFTDVAGNTASPLREITLDRNVTAAQAVQAFNTLDVDSASPQAWPEDTPHNQSYSIGGVMVTQADGGLVQGASLAAGGEEAVFTLREPQPPEPQWSFSQLGLEGATGETGSLALSFDDVMQQKSVSQQSLTINASQNDSVTLINSPEGMWDFSGQRAVEGQLFDVWHNSALSQGDPLGDVLIEQTVHVRLQ